jgi:hypothetical protein
MCKNFTGLLERRLLVRKGKTRARGKEVIRLKVSNKKYVAMTFRGKCNMVLSNTRRF